MKVKVVMNYTFNLNRLILFNEELLLVQARKNLQFARRGCSSVPRKDKATVAD